MRAGRRVQPHAALAVLALFVLAPSGSRAQTQAPVPTQAPPAEKKSNEPGPWQMAANVGIQVAQSAFSSNWRGGANGSVVWSANGDLTAERQFSLKFNLKNRLQLAYGQTIQQRPDPNDPNVRVWDAPEKTTDQIVLESIGRFSLESFVDPYVALRGDSQFNDESNPLGSIPFNPVRLMETAGAARVFEKTEDREFTSRIGFGFRQTFAQSFTDPVTLEKTRFSATDGGFEWQTDLKRPILDKRVLWKASLGVFQSVYYSQTDDLDAYDAEAADSAAAAGTTHGPIADFWKAVDVNFQTTLTSQITKMISVNLLFQWVYDKYDASANLDPTLPFSVRQAEVDRTVRKAGQYQEGLTLGITYRLL